MVNYYSTKAPEIQNGERIMSSVNDVGKTVYSHAEE